MDRLPKYNKGAQEVRNAPHGTRDDTLNEAASTETLESGDTEPLKEATRANAVPRDEVRAMIASAKASAENALRTPRTSRPPSPALIGARGTSAGSWFASAETG